MTLLLSRLFLILILPAIDIYVFRKITKLFPPFAKNKTAKILYWLTSFVIIAIMLAFSIIEYYKFREFMWPVFTTNVALLMIVYIPKAIAAIFFLITDLLKLFVSEVLLSKIWKINLIAIISLSVIFELLIVKGILFDRFNFKLYEKELHFTNLPKDFDNYRIIHLSDLHLGSFIHHKSQVKKLMDIINSQNPDLILFTGDLVNNTSREAKVFVDILSKMNAKDGIIAVTGNHDYGTYVQWNTEAQIQENFDMLIDFYDKIGATLLLNENIKIEIEDSKIYIAGIESSGSPPFDKLGDIEKSIFGIPENSFTIMLSHDPSFWEEEIIKYPEIDLTLSGHTHSMQLGIYSENLNLRWSPISLLYKKWHGLYRHNNQKLLINNGAGFIALPARIGAPPEIGLVVLKVKK